jgi:hypothetical protein
MWAYPQHDGRRVQKGKLGVYLLLHPFQLCTQMSLQKPCTSQTSSNITLNQEMALDWIDQIIKKVTTCTTNA